jgi:CheY-like chemotaxis protein
LPDLMLGLGPGDIGCDGPMHSPIKPIALTLFKSGMKEYRALVADVNLMGSLSGWDLARQVREREPTFPVIYMPGAAADDWASQGVPNSILLQKPFAPAQLVTAISQLLNQVPPLRENEAASTPVHFRFCVTNRKGMLWRCARPRTAGSVHAPAREQCRRVDFLRRPWP